MPKESLRTAYGKTLLKLGLANKDVVVLDADLAKSTQTALFGREWTMRFIDMGLSEQDMISTAAGIALTGKTVFASSFCVFLAGRVFDQIRQSVCYNNANVKLVGTHAGLGVGEDGATHQSLEDIALMRVLPNMRMVVPADAIETTQVIEYIAGDYGPFFVRLTRGSLLTIHDQQYRFRLGQASILQEGGDIALIAIGAMVEKALQAAELLKRDSIQATVVNLSTIKPLDQDLLFTVAKKTRGVITVEDHSIHGGMGSAVAEFLIQNRPVAMKLMGVDNQFGRSGSPEALYEHFHLTPQDIVVECKKIISSR